MSKNKTGLLAYRLSVCSRVIAGSLGGYILVNLLNLTLTYLLPTAPNRSLLLAMMLSFLFYTLTVIWVFSARTATRAWLGLLIVYLPLGSINLIFYFQGPVI